MRHSQCMKCESYLVSKLNGMPRVSFRVFAGDGYLCVKCDEAIGCKDCGLYLDSQYCCTKEGSND